MSVLSNVRSKSSCAWSTSAELSSVTTRHPCRCAFALPTSLPKNQVGARQGTFECRCSDFDFCNHARALSGRAACENNAASSWRTRCGAFGRRVSRRPRRRRGHSGRCGRGHLGRFAASERTDPERWDDSVLRAAAIQERAHGGAVQAWCWSPDVGHVRDQGVYRVAGRPLGPRSVLQDAALLLVVPHVTKRLCR